jgi:LacI family transcriptional regulator
MAGRTSSPTIADVAREAGVSISTVSRFLNGSSLVADETVGKVREAIERLGYLPRSAARSLALRRTNTLGVLVEALGTSFFASVIAGAEEAAYEQGYNLLVATTSHVHNGTLPALGSFNTDGLLVVNLQLERQLLGLFKNGYPAVSLYQPEPQAFNIPLVTVQNKRGAFQAVQHFITTHGFTYIGFLRGPQGNADSYWRELGYRKALKQYGIPLDERWIGDGGFSYLGARKTILEWFRRGKLPQAIFSGNDNAALDVMLTLHRLGLRVPEDVAIIGFDDSYLASSMVPSLTTVRAPIREMGREGIRKLLKLIHTGEAEPLTLLPTELVIRRSCGCTSLVEPEAWPDQVPQVLQESQIQPPFDKARISENTAESPYPIRT